MRDSETAWRGALYGPEGFFSRGAVPADHFRTAPLIGPELAEALLVLLDRVDFALGRPARLDFVDVGAGGGELSAAVRALAPGPLGRRLRVTAVDIGPERSLPGVRWTRELPSRVEGLLIGHEWLDAIPCPLVTGPHDDPWLARWWPLEPGWRAEVGAPRDAAWADAVSRVRGAALAVDYGHLRADRVAGRYRSGTFAAYRDGRQVTPVFDGSCDLTAHVALDACAEAAGGDRVLVSQRDALAALGLTATAEGTGLAWLESAARASRVAELRAVGGLGSFGWLLHGVGVPVSELLPPLPAWQP
ncbi:SAM-dependent MidA family methyltransferase [Saccharothrix tamanrassetensis]|uniref:SAM-dependent MidA family methyltransferase n=1 Tax=Saccharothrix tamanrassetensis TaxID=1051531 RepID=A0A841CH29_9PSEU|nr:SAM-dependent methyltransferase [Saccharothrix tamanrassetensis]MBB5956681.1 SAM-dependent MidA family methyltransferase [Saccharothrix tamanrassetensis]